MFSMELGNWRAFEFADYTSRTGRGGSDTYSHFVWILLIYF